MVGSSTERSRLVESSPMLDEHLGSLRVGTRLAPLLAVGLVLGVVDPRLTALGSMNEALTRAMHVLAIAGVLVAWAWLLLNLKRARGA